jgi:tetratricopeptide (TPR) repeat protein
MKHVCVVITFVVISRVSSVGVVAADRAWVRVASPHFTVASDGSEKSARVIAWQLEQLRAALHAVWPWARLELDKPVLVLAARDEQSMKLIAPQFWERGSNLHPASVFVTGPDRHYIVLRADVKAEDTDGTNPYFNAYWSYAGLVLNTSINHHLPAWFRRGLAGLFGNTIIRESLVQVGRPVRWHLQQLAGRTRLSVDELLMVDDNSPWLTDGDKMSVFDAECWAFVHYLMFADKGVHRPQLDRFATLLSEGKSPAAATELVFGNVQSLNGSLAFYITRQIFEYGRIDTDVNVNTAAFAAAPLSAPDAAMMRAAFHIAMGRLADARALLDAARKTDTSASATYEVDGLILDREEKGADARAAFAKAVELRSTHFYPHYRWAALTWQPELASDVRARVQTSLERSIELNGHFASAHALLGEVQAQAGRGDDALASAKKAITLEPEVVWHRLSFARVLWSLSRRGEAQRVAQDAVAIARTDDERRAAQQLLDFIVKNSS